MSQQLFACLHDLQDCATPSVCWQSGCQRAKNAAGSLREADPQRDEAPPRQRIAQVIRLSTITTHDLPVDQVLDGAVKADLKCAVVLGYRQDGTEFFASTMADGADVLWLLERLKLQLLNGPDEDA